MKNILVIGAAGLLGQKIFQYGQDSHNIILADINYINSLPKRKYMHIDITDYVLTEKVIKKSNPDWIILTAALTNVDLCETEKKLAENINIKGPENVARIAKDVNAKLIYISTDFVFDGKKQKYTETDVPKPISFYGKSKLLGETAVKINDPKVSIIRTSVLFGWNKDPENSNYVTWIINKLKNEKEISITINQKNTPTLADNLANAILEMVNNELFGLYHMSGSECINRYEFAVKIAKVFNLNSKLIIPIKEFKQKAERPKNSCLDVSKASKDLNFHFYNINEALNFMKKQKADL
ncbi:MAG: dTDP-4-dehydrorhamnose reductase [Candidatus Lokiarchaeota archaeon]|nr:dTDP-4-dehydrorhamnose reductase [Candidatus Lokiarchaeota archaeon]